MQIKLVKGKIEFQLVDQYDDVYSAQEYQTSANLEFDLPEEANDRQGRTIKLVLKLVKRPQGYLRIDGKDYQQAIKDRATAINYEKDWRQLLGG